MQKALALYQTTIGKKVIVALTGAIMFGFLIGHLIGNLQIFRISIPMLEFEFGGPDKINAYGAFLHHTPALLWGTRLVLLASIVAHVYLTIELRERNQTAKTNRADGGRYAKYTPRKTNAAAMWMILSGSTILLYLVYHLLHLTIGKAPLAPEFMHVELDGREVANVYDNLVYGFRQPIIALVYIAANLMLGAHLFHGARSLFQTLGLNHNRYNKRIDMLAYGLAGFITIGNVLIPLACVTHMVPSSTEISGASAETEQ